jgi:hypothetical protein
MLAAQLWYRAAGFCLLRMAMIWLSVKREVFMQSFLCLK